METLRNLQQLGSLAGGRFNAYDGKDFILPQAFKDAVTEINNNPITYFKYSAVIQTKGGQSGTLSIFMPNQWFYIASYFTDFYNELMKYKQYAIKIFTKERLKDLKGSNLSIEEEKEISSLILDDQSKKYIKLFVTNYDWWHGAKTIDRGDFYVSPILSFAFLVNASQSYVADLCTFLADKPELVSILKNSNESYSSIQKGVYSLQQIYYGAPGTGKSHRIKEQLTKMNVPNENIFRTTFHPDSDYSSFVGAYKPTMKKQYRYDGKVKARYYEDDDLADAKQNDIIIDKVIQYNFVPQTFLMAYTQAYKKPAENVFLIIEEINRGNCAQIFGDLFQLLDRDDNGVSEYPIKADADLKVYLEDALGKDADGIKNGELYLPSNLYIWATMNTSDQSLFPIDSAFKRRWDWEYEPIKYKNTDWLIEIGDNNYSWTSFQRIINDKIFEATNSEDKMLGDYFVKPCNNVISEKQFINKVLFYLWNDVCKDGDGDIFRTEDNKDVKFSDLYNEYGTNTLQSMMKYLGVQLLSEEIIEDVEDFVDNTEINELKNNVDINNSYSAQQEYGNKFDYSKYSLNGSGSYSKGAVVYEAVKLYCNNHREQNAEDIVRQWLGLGIKVPNLIETESVHANRKENTRDAHFDEKSKQLQLANGQTIYVSNQFNVERITDFTTKVNAQSWGIRIEKI